MGLSFVRTAEDIKRLREELYRRGSKARIIAKIEKPQAVANLQAIVAETDAVMIARGDLGVELDVIRVPEIQKRIIETCRRARVPVITATQMLGSMELSSRPTRAEASDVYNAVLDGTDAVMLSGETAIGGLPGRIGRDDEPDRRRSRATTVRETPRECNACTGRRRATLRSESTGGEQTSGGACRIGSADHRERGRGRLPDRRAA